MNTRTPPFLVPAVLALAAVLALVTGCTRENKAFCCTDPADCAAAGIDESQRACADGLACVENACVVPTCASAGCDATAPVCVIATDTCGGCTDSSECTRFAGTDVCDPASGSCVQCVTGGDCGTAAPICDNQTCRGCTLDSECPSGACAEDGSCVDEVNAVYLATNGVDAVPCSRAQPCASLLFGVQQTSSLRNHVVFVPGNYVLSDQPIGINAQVTAAASLVLHGGGSTLTGGSSDGFISLRLPTTIRDLNLINPDQGNSGVALYVQTSAVLERMTLRANTGLLVVGQAVVRELHVEARETGISNTGSLTLDRATIQGGATALLSFDGTLDVTNLLAFGTSGIAVDVGGATGSISSSTIYSTATGTDPAGVRCTGALTIRSSIIWTPTVPTARPGLTGSCTLQSSIVGPVGVPGAVNNNPLFVSASTNDFHLSGGSPARDMVDTGPATDFEGDPRPRGARFDIGADEAP